MNRCGHMGPRTTCPNCATPSSPPVSRPEGLTAEHEAQLAANELLREELQSLRAQLAEREQELQTYKTLAKVGTWHNDCRPNRLMAARELDKRQAVIDKMADAVSEANRAREAAESTLSALRALLEPIGELEQKATPGPWHAATKPHPEAVRLKKEAVSLYGPDCRIYSMALDYGVLPETHARQRADAELIAALRNLCPALRQTLEQT